MRANLLLGSWACPLALAVLAGGWLLLRGEPGRLDAGVGTSLPGNVDLDGDGLEDTQEYVLGTMPDYADTDADGYEDLEEVARGSDPLDYDDVPTAQPMSIGVYGYVENGLLYFHAAVYVQGNETSFLQPEVGMVLSDGNKYPFQNSFIGTGTSFHQSTLNPGDLLVVLSLPIQESFLSRLGQMNFYGFVRDKGPLQRPSVVATISMLQVNGVSMMLQNSPSSVGGGNGIVYRPLTGPEVDPPMTATDGQVCWQDISPVGSEGSLVQFEVNSAGCEDFDSFCQGAGCSGTTGTSVTMVDPGALLGG